MIETRWRKFELLQDFLDTKYELYFASGKFQRHRMKLCQKSSFRRYNFSWYLYLIVSLNTLRIFVDEQVFALYFTHFYGGILIQPTPPMFIERFIAINHSSMVFYINYNKVFWWPLKGNLQKKSLTNCQTIKRKRGGGKG